MLLAVLDPELARHVAACLKHGREHLRRDWQWPPAGADELERTCRALASSASNGHERTKSADLGDVSHDDAMTLLLDYRAVADVLAIGERTVRRLVDTGELPVVEIGGAKRVHRDDLERFVDAHRVQKAEAPA